MVKVRVANWMVAGATAVAIAGVLPQTASADSPATLPQAHFRVGTAQSYRPVQLPPDRQDGLGSARLPTMPGPVVIVRTVSSGGFDWLDAAVGALVAMALVLVGAAVRLGRTGKPTLQES